jgi:putative acetyltransferase
MMAIRKEIPADHDAVHYVVARAFGQEVEAEMVDKLRDGRMAVVSLVAVVDNSIVGHILFSPVTIEPEIENFKALVLAPVSVLPEYQDKGIGAQLITAGLEECRRLGYGAIFLVGQPEYYPRFGFVPAAENSIRCEFEVPEQAWMVLELKPDTLSGRTGTVFFQPEFKETF